MDSNHPLGYSLSPDPLQQSTNPLLSSQAAYPVATQGPQSQQASFYQNPFSQTKTTLDQQQQRYPLGAVTAAPMMQPVGPGGAMMPPGFPQSSAPSNVNFSAPFAHSPVPTSIGQFSQPQAASSLNLASTAAPAFQPSMASASVNNMLAAQQRPNQRLSTPQLTAQAAVQAQAVAREKARVATLLEINSLLLQEVVNLQAAGKSGAPPTQPGSQEANPSPSSETNETPKSPAQKPSPEYIECLRRLQANLAYLASIADRAKKSGGVPPSAPAIMTPPPNTPSLNEMYERLNELFPRVPRGGVAGVSAPKPNLQAGQGSGNPSASLAPESAT